MFNTLKSLVGTVMMVSMLGTASLATSCYDEYDDTEIKGQISQIQNDLTALTQRVAKLENKLNDEVAALKSMIQDLNVVVSAEKVGDNWEIVLSDGTEFTVYGPCNVKDTDTDTDVDTYLVPKQDTDGVWYWAVVTDTLGEDITEEWLLVDGKKVPAFGQECTCEPVEPCTCTAPELKFDVDADGNLLVSIDGGANWTNSGINANDFCGCTPNEGGNETTVVECNCIIADVDIWSKPGYAIFTTVDGDTFEVEVAQDGAGIVANIKGGRLNFTFGESKVADLDLKNVVDIAVMDKPEGWRAKIEGSKLTVTAPAEAAVTEGTADAEGYIRLHATSDEGTCKIAKVKVSTSAGLSIEVDAKSGDFVVYNPMVDEYTDWWSGETYYEFSQFYIGYAPIAEFEADPAAYLETVFEGWGGYMIGNNLYQGAPYEAGVNEVMIFEFNIADICYALTYGELPEGEQYVVWACPMDDTGYNPNIEDVVYGYYKPSVAKVEQLSASFCDVEISVQLMGSTSYDIVIDLAQNWKANEYYDPFEMALEDWQYSKPMYENYGMEYHFGYGYGVTGDVVYEGSLAEFQKEIYQAYQADLLKPNTKYALVVLPIDEGKAYDAYTVEDILYYEFTTSGVEAGGNATITITPTSLEYTKIKASVELSDDVVLAYYNFMDPTNEAVVAGGETLANALLEGGYMTTEFPINATKSSLSMGQTVTMAVMALDAEGKYTLATQDLSTPEMSYSTATVAIDEIKGLNNSISVKLSASDTAVKYRVYPLASYNLYYYTEETIKNNLLTNGDEYYYYSTINVATGAVTGKSGQWDAATSTLTLGGVYNGTAYTVFVVAQFEDGSWSANMASAEATPALVLEPFFASTTTEAQAILTTLGDPMIYDFAVDGNWLDFSVKFEKITEGMEIYVMCSEEEVMNSQAGPLDMQRAPYIVDNGTTLDSADEHVTFYMNHNGKDLYYAVKDAEGNYYGTFTFDMGQVYDYMMAGGAGVGGMEP